MNCVYCGYEDGWNNKKQDSVGGEEGAFYELEARMENPYLRAIRGYDKKLYACPKCKKVFID